MLYKKENYKQVEFHKQKRQRYKKAYANNKVKCMYMIIFRAMQGCTKNMHDYGPSFCLRKPEFTLKLEWHAKPAFPFYFL